MKIKSLLNGWKNFLDKSEVAEEMAESRAKHCLDCVHNRKTILTAFIDDDLVKIRGRACMKCKCPLSAKLRSINENCPIGLW